jgi:2-keto-4-pentenoate hydratase/2-oxohepta-3-ene-1,7-dioic acid hydratase in catechol pathway
MAPELHENVRVESAPWTFSRRSFVIGGSALMSTPISKHSSVLAADSGHDIAQPVDYGIVGRLNARIANLGIRDGYGLGLETDRGILDVCATANALTLACPRDMDDLLQNGRGAELRALMAAVNSRPQSAVIVPKEKVSFAPLVTRPEKIICVGFNYRKHAEETHSPLPTVPALFNKYNNALNRHGGEIRLPTHVDDRFDYETELVIVLGRECLNVPEREALDYVAGYATGNDFSARRLQTATSQFMAGKTSNGFAPVGPWLVTRDRVPDPNRLSIKTWVNGAVRQDSNTSDMIFDCRKLISFASSLMTLKPGDLLFTGTPQGVILGEKIPPEQRRWLRAGDEVVSSIEGLGELRVTLV